MRFKKLFSTLIAAVQLSALAPAAIPAVSAENVSAAAFAELSFTSTGIQDTSDYAKKWKVQPISYGSAPVAYNEDLNLYEASFGGNASNFYKLILNKELRQKMTKGYSIQAYFKPSATSANMNVIGAAEGQGFDFEVLKDGYFDACLNHGSGWVKSGGDTPGHDVRITANNYYFMTLTYDRSNIKVYQNGDLKQTVQSSGSIIFLPEKNTGNSLGDPYYGLVVGGDYGPARTDGYATERTTSQSPFSGTIAQVKLYEGAMTADEVKASYASMEARKGSTAFDTLNTFLTGALAQKQAEFSDDQDLTALAQEGWELMGDIAASETQVNAYLTKAQAYEPKHPVYEDGVKLRIGVLSDFQYGRGSNHREDLKDALTQLLKRAGGQEKLDVLLLPGDLSHNAYTQEYDQLVADLEEVLPRET